MKLSNGSYMLAMHNRTFEYWYDRHLELWTAIEVDGPHGAQIGTAIYSTKRDLLCAFIGARAATGEAMPNLDSPKALEDAINRISNQEG